jgi:hypothetical protein
MSESTTPDPRPAGPARRPGIPPSAPSGSAFRRGAGRPSAPHRRDALATFRASGFGYFLEQATRPQTIGYALLDSPLALAAWMLDHDTDAYYKISRAFVDGQPSGGLTRDHILDIITTYWLTGTGASSPTSPTSMRPTGAATLPPGKSLGCSRPRSRRPSGRYAQGHGHERLAGTVI